MSYFTKLEKTGKRSLHYNLRHRIYGQQMKMYDADNIEFDWITKKPVCLIETKFGAINNIDLNHDQFDCLLNVADPLHIPLICLVTYIFHKNGEWLNAEDSFEDFGHIQFLAIGVNSYAKRLLPVPKRMTEIEWTAFLHQLRGEPMVEAEPLCSTWRNVNKPFILIRP